MIACLYPELFHFPQIAFQMLKNTKTPWQSQVNISSSTKAISMIFLPFIVLGHPFLQLKGRCDYFPITGVIAISVNRVSRVKKMNFPWIWKWIFQVERKYLRFYLANLYDFFTIYSTRSLLFTIKWALSLLIYIQSYRDFRKSWISTESIKF